MSYLTRLYLIGIFTFPVFSHYSAAKTTNTVASPESVKVIFVAGFNSGYLQCFRVNKQTGYLADIPQCDKNFLKDLPSERLYDLEFQNNHLYLISGLGNDTLEYDVDPNSLIVSNPRHFAHGVDTFAGFLFGDVGYFPSTMENRIYQFSVNRVDGSTTPMSPFYVASRKTIGAAFLTQSLLDQNLFYLSGLYSGTIELFRRSQDGTLHDTGITTVMPGQGRSRHIAVYQDFLYVTNQSNSTIFQFKVDHTDGHLIPLNPSFIDTYGTYPSRTIISGNNAYSPNVMSGNITSFTIRQNGTLAYKDPALVEIGQMPFQIIVDNQVHLLYANSENTPWISAVYINPDGSLDTRVLRFRTHAPDPRYFLETEIQPTH